MCPHNHIVSEAFPFTVLAAEDNMPGGVFNYRFGQEVQISQNFKSAGIEVLAYYLNNQTYSQVLSHGCWCAHLAAPDENDFQGVDIEDDLDYICKRWFMARKCLAAANGVCEGERLRDTYTISFESEKCPWEGNTACGSDVINSGLNEDVCNQGICEVDTYYANEIRDYLNSTVSESGGGWQPKIRARFLSGLTI